MNRINSIKKTTVDTLFYTLWKLYVPNIKTNVTQLSLIAFLIAGIGSMKTNAQNYPFQNPDLPIEERVNDILSQLTTAEKLKLLRQNEPEISRLGLRPFTYWTEGLHGVAWGQSGTLTATQFPQAYGLGETWDTEIIQRVGAQVAVEMRAIYNSGKCGLMLRAPVCDLIRDPRWGRSEESYGEDPYHAGKLSVALIKGLRGNNPKYFMVASLLKHFVAYSSETGRTTSSSNFDQRNMHEYYAMPFEFACVEGGAQGYMTAYNAVNGVHCIFNTNLKKISREIWGWDGAVCSDNYDLVTSTGYSSMAQKAAAAVKNGTIGSFDDPELGNAPEDAFSSGLMTIEDVNIVIKNTMRVRTRLGDLDPQAVNPFKSITGTPWTSDSAKALARLVTQKSIVLLKNENNTLPLNKNSVRSIAIIGAMADSVSRDWYGGYPPYKISPRTGITSKAGTGITINYAENNNNSAAVNAAKSSDIAIVFAGNHPTCSAGWGVCASECEGKEEFDRKQISLIATQDSLIRQVFRANPKTIVVLISNFPYAITWANDNVPAIIHMTHSSQESGSALADVLYGDYNPAGRLNVTWPRSLSDLPDLMDYDIRNGRTYMYFKKTHLYPFGYGLSYTNFSYDNLATSSDNLCQGTLDVSVDVTNAGTVAGEEVVQLYVKYPGSSIPRPIKQLRGFKRTASIPAGNTVKVTFPLSFRDIAFWDSTQTKWVVESGTIQILAGGSSADSALKVSKNVTVCGGAVVSTNDKKSIPPGFATIKSTDKFSIVTKGGVSGISLALKQNDSYDLCVFDLKGVRISHLEGIAKSDETHRVPFSSKIAGSGLYLISGRVSGTEISRTCIFK
jgi:beta-glucosidase